MPNFQSSIVPGAWIMHMRWSQLLFMHWPVPVRSLRALIPSDLEIDTFEGQAWLGIVPFLMQNVRPRCVPAIRGLSAFPELNVRTYVKHRGRTGVWFFSLDAASRVAVRGARAAFFLPYFDARMTVRREQDHIHYDSLRTHRNAPPARLAMRYRPIGPAYSAPEGTLDFFLTNRLCLFSANRRKQVHRGDIAHVPWPLQPAEADVTVNEMTGQIALTLPDTRPLLHYVDRLDVVAWPVRRVEPEKFTIHRRNAEHAEKTGESH